MWQIITKYTSITYRYGIYIYIYIIGTYRHCYTVYYIKANAVIFGIQATTYKQTAVK